jgi:polar amino acid transport system permease protein
MSDLSVVAEHLPRFIGGAVTTIEVSLLALMLATSLGLVIGLARASRRRWLYLPSVVYVEFLRSVPPLVLLFMTFYAVPIVMGIDMPGFPAAVVALGVAGSAAMAEIIRGGVEAIGRGQWDAAHSLGMRYPEVTRYVVLPQAVRLALPPAISLYVSMLKDSSLVLLVGVVELTAVGMQVRGLSFGRGTLVVFLVVAAFYFVMCYTLSLAGGWIGRRVRI